MEAEDQQPAPLPHNLAHWELVEKKIWGAEGQGKISTVGITMDPLPPNIRGQRVGRPFAPKKEALLVKYSIGPSAPKMFFWSMHHTLTCLLRSR